MDANVLTANVKENGMGLINVGRFGEAIAQLGETYEYKGVPDINLIFTAEYLPVGGFSLK